MPVFALYNFDDVDALRDSALGNGAQDGFYNNGAASVGGQLVLDGVNDYGKIFSDPSFQLARGTVEIDFTVGEFDYRGQQTVLSRDGVGQHDGSFRVQIDPDGTLTVTQETGADPVVFSSGPGFFTPGDTLNLSYSFDEGGSGGALVVENTTTGGIYEADVPNTVSLVMEGPTPVWTVGAGQQVTVPGDLVGINQYFTGTVEVFSLSDSVDNVATAPDANPDDATTSIATPVIIPVLANDTDPNGDTLSILGTPTSSDGTVVVNPDGTLTFTPNAGFTGTAVIDYTITDGTETDSSTVTVCVEGPERDGIVRGTTGGDLIDIAYVDPFDGDQVDANDALIGGDAPNDDRVRAGDGNDTVLAGTGDDTVWAGNGDDEVFGQDGDDDLRGNAGNDSLIGGDGSDIVYGQQGNDVIDTSGTACPLPDIGYPGLYPADSNPTNDLDTVYGGLGHDFITTGDDADVVYGDAGRDTIDGGIDNDTLYGGQGGDFIVGGEGADTIDGGRGSDVIYGGLGPDAPDAINIRDDAGDLRPENGNDSITGGTGADTIYGLDDDDTIAGGIGNDVLFGGIDEDEVRGDEGDDRITGGQGVDTLSGGADRDTFVVGSETDGAGDVIDGNEEGNDFDTLDLRGSGPLTITYADDNPENGRIDFRDGEGNVTSTLTFSNIENVIPCFTPGTLIATPKGEMLVEHLNVGDKVITRDNGIQEIRWVGANALTWADFTTNPHLKPVLVKRGSLGNDLPEQDMLVSPNHRLLVANERTSLYFDEHEVLVAAKHLVGAAGVNSIDSVGTTYLHFMFDRHEVVLSNGAWTESFQPGDYTLKGMGNAQRSEIFEIFPELKTDAGLAGYQAARRTLKRHEASLLSR
jgi:Ca2+-binding RTX toxin-like protein